MKLNTKSIVAGVFASLITTSAFAGGFNRGTADTDILFENDPVSVRVGAAHTAPQRSYKTLESIMGSTTKATDGVYSNSYQVPSAAFKYNLTDSLRCAGTFTDPLGASSSYGRQSIEAGKTYGSSGTVSNDIASEEYAVTCGLSFDAGKGKVWILGGLLWESISAEEVAELSATGAVGLNGLIGAAVLSAGDQTTLALSSDYNHGYRLGLAYEIPEIALRIQGLYRSEVSHDLTGSLTVPVVGQIASTGSVVTPQSFELKAQSGIAPGTLAFASVKWTDWSVLQEINYAIGTAPQSFEFFWRDGWTVSGGIAKSLTEDVSVLAALSWDKGVSTTEDAYTDTWTLATAANLKDDFGGTWRLAGAVSYLTAGEVKQATVGLGGVGPGNKFGYTVGNDWAYTGSISYNFKF